MAQQINLYSPILLAPRRYFSALAVVQALGLFVLGLGALAVWSEVKTQELRAAMAAAAQGMAAERQRIDAALALQPAARDGAALEQELAQAGRVLAQSQALLADLTGAAHPAPAKLLQLLALTTPAPVWLTEIRLSAGQAELAGLTLQTEALRPWLARLQADNRAGGLGDLARGSMRVEQAPPTGGAPAWAFRVGQGAAAEVKR